jgi:hypothetical protein
MFPSKMVDIDVLVDGVSGYLWIFMNKGQLFKTKTKTFLTILNAAIIPLGITIVGSLDGVSFLFFGVLTVSR